MAAQTMQTLVTGGGGFIGSHLVEGLLRENHRVRVLDNFATGRRENLAAVREAVGPAAERLEVLEGDLRKDADVKQAVAGVEIIFHLGALGSVPRSIADPMTSHEVNATGTLRLLLAARDAGVRRVLYAGSSSVYGEVATLPKTEDLATIPISPYANTKRAAELYCRIFAPTYGLETTTLRYFNVFGPRQNPKLQYAAVIPIFIDRMLHGEPALIHGDGEQSRDFTYVANVVHANLLAARAPAAAVSGRIFNIACGSRFSLNYLVELLRRETGHDIPPVHGEPRPGDVAHSQADISQARQAFGYEPIVPFEEGIARTVAYFKGRAVP